MGDRQSGFAASLARAPLHFSVCSVTLPLIPAALTSDARAARDQQNRPGRVAIPAVTPCPLSPCQYKPESDRGLLASFPATPPAMPCNGAAGALHSASDAEQIDPWRDAPCHLEWRRRVHHG